MTVLRVKSTKFHDPEKYHFLIMESQMMTQNWPHVQQNHFMFNQEPITIGSWFNRFSLKVKTLETLDSRSTK